MSIGLELVAGSGRFSKLETVSHGSRTLSSLESLNLSHNELVTLSSDVFCGLRHLRRLRLEGNRLQSLGDRAFYWLDRLEELNLERNQLTHLDEDDFDGYENYDDSHWCSPSGRRRRRFSRRRRSSGRRRSYPSSLKRSLLELNLGGNRLTTLPNNLFNGFRSLRTLQMQRNQLVRLGQRLFQILGKVHGELREFQRVCSSSNQVNCFPSSENW